jgi:hypothetical protein
MHPTRGFNTLTKTSSIIACAAAALGGSVRPGAGGNGGDGNGRRR